MQEERFRIAMPVSAPPVDRLTDLRQQFEKVRKFTRVLCDPLQAEDYVIQSMPDVSPTRWHLAHTTWFFETFVLAPFQPDYEPHHPAFGYLFNSYYNTVGAQYPRHARGLLSRPTVQEVWDYRHRVDDAVAQLLDASSVEESVLPIVELGLQHEQQHQELLLTDIKHVFSCNPLFPTYRDEPLGEGAGSQAIWRDFSGGIHSIGHQGPHFAFDNESPRHEVLLQPYRLQDRLVTNGEFAQFIDDGGYERPEFWLSLGWATVQDETWQHPLYWRQQEDGWHEFRLDGLQPLAPYAPVTHVSYFEADAFARWAGARLPTEAEWEVAAAGEPQTGHFADTLHIHPQAAPSSQDRGLRQCYGDAWEWTASPYVAYPGYAPPEGALGEYNGKFMCNQFVLRGGSCATSAAHLRCTYRNFFSPASRWQFTGIRLAT